MSDRGTAMLGMIVAAKLRRKTKVTSTTSRMAKINSCCTARTEARMLWVRSVRTVSSAAAGRLAESCGSSACTRSTTSITLAPGWRWMLTSTAGSRSAQAASRRSSAAFSIRATSPSRSGAPSRQAMIRLRNSSTERSWSFASIRMVRMGPSKLPLGWLALAAAMAERTSARLRPRCASSPGLICTRTAGRWPPARLTMPTPGICASFWAMRVSTRSCTCGSGRLAEVTARVMIGVSAGLTLR